MTHRQSIKDIRQLNGISRETFRRWIYYFTYKAQIKERHLPKASGEDVAFMKVQTTSKRISSCMNAIGAALVKDNVSTEVRSADEACQAVAL